MSNLMLHCGGQAVTFEELGGFNMPVETETYKPVAHQDLVRLAVDRITKELGYEGPMEWQHGVNKHGQQYFGICKMTDLKLTEQHCLSMGLRGSYDKSLSNGICLGPNAFVCDNLSFGAALVTLLRKHTINVYRDLKRLFGEALETAVENATLHAKQIESWSTIPVTQEQGYEKIGLMRGRGILTPNITNNMFKEWQRPKHAIFEDRSAFSLYNAATEAVKSVTPGRVFKTYTGVHKFFELDVVRPVN
jgi:hypothetical protein